MSIFITGADGVEREVFAALEGGRLFQMVRCKDRATFDRIALSVGLLVHENPAIPARLDAQGAEIAPAVPASGDLVAAPNTTVVRLGHIEISPAIYDSEGKVITPAILDSRYHVNFWLAPEIVALKRWEKWTTAWTIRGKAIDDGNRDEKSKLLYGVELIDPATVSSPKNVLL